MLLESNPHLRLHAARRGAVRGHHALAGRQARASCARLDEFGIDYIEGGFPASNPKDVAFFQRGARPCDLKHAQIAAFGSTCKKGVAAADDPGLADLHGVRGARGHHRGEDVGRSGGARVADDARGEPAHDRRVGGPPEGGMAGASCSMPSTTSTATRRTATTPWPAWGRPVEAGADSVDLCETNGGALPFEVERDRGGHGRRASRARRFGIHCHNDSGCAVANTLAAVRAGVTQRAGHGERHRRARGQHRPAHGHRRPGAEDGLRAAWAADSLRAAHRPCPSTWPSSCNVSVPAHHPYTGSSAFAHKGGLHASAIARFPEAYEHAQSRRRWATRSRMLVSELAGKASLLAKAQSLGHSTWRRPGDGRAGHARRHQGARGGRASPTRWPTARWGFCSCAIWGCTRPPSRWRASASSWTTARTPERWRRTRMSEATVKIHVGEAALRGHGRGRRPRGRARRRAAHGHRGVVSAGGGHGACGLQGAPARRDPRHRCHHAGDHHHHATAWTPGAPWASPKTSSRPRGTRWSTPSNTAS